MNCNILSAMQRILYSKIGPGELFFGSSVFDYGAIFYIIAHACVWSWMEVEMEGRHGWAVNLPTSCAFGGWTYYHIAMNVIVLLSVLPAMRLYTSSFYAAWVRYFATLVLYVFRVGVWFTVEDVFWFAINPNYGMQKYTPSSVWWHAEKSWWWGTLLLNWIFLLACIVLAVAEKISADNWTIARETLVAGLFLALSCGLSLAFNPSRDEDAIPDKTGCYANRSTVF